MMAEGNESHGGEFRGQQPGGLGPDLPGRRTEGDLLAERRARRAAESGEVILARRAEAAEATIQTLEGHVSSLQQRLLDAEEDVRRTSELLEIERTAAREREHELRRVKQREYAEQQLRVETEDRLTQASELGERLDRESRAEREHLARRLGAAEDDTQEMLERLEDLQRQLDEAEQAAAAERAAVKRAEQDLLERLSGLERRATRTQEGLAVERAARERSEALLEGMRHGHRRMEQLVGDMKGIVERLSGAIAAAPALSPPPQPAGTEMAEALAAAVERLRARAETLPAPEPEAAPAPERAPAGSETPLADAGAAPEIAGVPASAPVVLGRAPAPAPGPGALPDPAPLPASPAVPVPAPATRPTHKHALSLIGRWRIRRKQRRTR